MKLLFIITFTLIAGITFGQKAILKNDTLTYLDKHYTAGDTLTLSYGSGTDGKFVFVYMGKEVGGQVQLPAVYSKYQIVIEKAYKFYGKNILKGELLDAKIGNNKIFIQIEGAIDKKEIID